MAVFLNELLERGFRLIAASLWAAVCTSGFLLPRPLTPSTASNAVFGTVELVSSAGREIKGVLHLASKGDAPRTPSPLRFHVYRNTEIK